MKLLLGLLLLGGLLCFGYIYYQSRQLTIATPPTLSSSVVITHGQSRLNEVASVLGASIQNAVESGKAMLNDATDGASDPIINRALQNIQDEVKDLPQEAVDKVKYEFCKDVVTDYENR